MDVFPWDMETQGDVPEDHPRCDKMSVCGTVEQTKGLTFHAYDNLERRNATVEVLMHFGQESKFLSVSSNVAGHFYEYEFEFSNTKKGIAVLEVFVDNEQIPESPFRVEVTELECVGERMAASGDGICECSGDSIIILGGCVSQGVFAAVLSTIVLVIAGQILLWYAAYKRRKADALWQVKIEELRFSQPVEVIGQGAFGVVLLAEYHGTKVAIKR
eukprot:scaffold11633_cov118-Cylindrotheca_fusiformis.AAC.1